MSILNRGWIYDSITRNQDSGSVPYRWTHGANDSYIGSGIFYYAIPYFLKAKVCVCLGSGGGFVPRLMTDCVWELNEVGMYGDDKFGEVYVIDATNGVNGEVNWSDPDSFLRENFNPTFINATTEDAFYGYFIHRDKKIDYLHIDADHSYEGCKLDFDLYSTIMSPTGIITIHDTDNNYWDNYIKSENESHDECDGPNKVMNDIRNKGKWEVFNFFDFSLGENPAVLSSSGLTMLRKI